MMTDEAYIAACQKLASQYSENQSSMAEYLAAVQKLREQYLNGRINAPLPVVP